MCFKIFQNEKSPFQAVKRRSSKSRKIAVFPKVKNWPFFHLFLKVIQARKMCFTIFQNEKSPFQAIKTRSSKSRKIAVFPRGLVDGFGQKLAIFPFFFLKVIQAREMCFTIFYKEKNVFLSYKNKKVRKSKNCHYSKGVNPWFW